MSTYEISFRFDGGTEEEALAAAEYLEQRMSLMSSFEGRLIFTGLRKILCVKYEALP